MTDGPEPLRYTGHLLRRAQQLHLALWHQEVSQDISSVQFAALAVLDRRPGISQRELCRELDLDRSTIADVVSRMVRRGAISREHDNNDRRRNILALTREGRAELSRLRPGVERVETELTAALSTGDRSALRSLLRAVLVNGQQQGLLESSEQGHDASVMPQ